MHPKLFPTVDDDFFGNNDISQLFEVQRNLCIPAVNIYELPDKFIVEMAIPGFQIQDISIRMEKNVLIISSDAHKQKDDPQSTCLRKEFCYKSFIRKFTIPVNILTEEIKAVSKNGILKISLPKNIAGN